MRGFAEKLHYTDQNRADEDHRMLLESPALKKPRRRKIVQQYESFKANSAPLCWRKKAADVGTKITIKKAALDSMDVGYKQAKLECSRQLPRTAELALNAEDAADKQDSEDAGDIPIDEGESCTGSYYLFVCSEYLFHKQSMGLTHFAPDGLQHASTAAYSMVNNPCFISQSIGALL
ncbi:hypothetical protein BC939DRAFT_521594 [Gamsiella multidivaricata]|uniref:uncharacterized protein n=1 Tax=Gamsiella multidivaricata TaxID=101098 RepID=UPI0022201F1F|nr:uncharacterized protein BC939DRAFT_521594 [Gamsiella multidivaricata]KAI7830392.1 hypothetical protein BC939DRAFT_521594 [Gamsiella multidivaricata]